MPFSAEVARLALLLETSKPELDLWLLQEGWATDLRSPAPQPHGLYPLSFSCFGPALVHTPPLLLAASSVIPASSFLLRTCRTRPSLPYLPAPNRGLWSEPALTISRLNLFLCPSPLLLSPKASVSWRPPDIRCWGHLTPRDRAQLLPDPVAFPLATLGTDSRVLWSGCMGQRAELRRRKVERVSHGEREVRKGMNAYILVSTRIL